MKKPQDIVKLTANGLYAAKTRGNGNCLFNALSDQLNGDESKHMEFRTKTVRYMVENADEFKQFIVVNDGVRRNPKRKNAGSMYSSRPDVSPKVTEEQIEKAFDQRVKMMAQGGAYGDNLEIVAFSSAFKVDVKIYSEETGVFYIIKSKTLESVENRPEAYIVYHPWEHYSSIRNVAGPHMGLPNIIQTEFTRTTEQASVDNSSEGPKIEDWMVDIAMKSLPYPQNQPANRASVEKMLKQCNGNVNHAVGFLLPDSSPESSGRSSSIERDPDSDDERSQKPNKKRDRRISRPHPLRNDLAMHVKDQTQLHPDPRHLAKALKEVSEKPFDPDETEEENWQGGSQSPKSTSSSEVSGSDASTNQLPKEGRAILKINPPKKQSYAATKESGLSSNNSGHPSSSGFDSEADKKAPRDRVKAKPRRRLISGNQRNKEMAEQAARNANNQKLDMRIQAIHI